MRYSIIRLLFLPLLFCALTVNAQKKKRPVVPQLTTFDKKAIRFGFYFGANTMDAGLRFHPSIQANPAYQKLEAGSQAKDAVDGTGLPLDKKIYAEVESVTPGFSVGIVTNFRINEYWDLRILPGMSFGSRDLSYSEKIYASILNPVATDTLAAINLKSSYIDLPILFKYKAKRITNNRPYIIAGPSFHFDLEKKGRDENIINVAKTSINFDVGLGLDSYMQFFRLSTELKYSIGLNNIIKYDLGGENGEIPPVYSYPIKTFHAHMFTLLVYFE